MFQSCRSLRSLLVMRCPNLVSFSLNLQETPSLERFILKECPKLIPHRFNGFAFAASLRRLSINSPFSSDDSSVDDFDWSGLRSASTLRELRLEGLPHTESLPHQLQYLTTLTSLSLHNFGGIRVLPDWIGNLVSLETLKLRDCDKLQSLPPEAAMRRLTKLTCVDVFDWSGLRSASTLRELQLRGLPHTESLPHQLQYLATLTSLTLANFGGIEVLPDWIGDLVSLETLELSDCENLRSLPSEAAMRRLTKLTRVQVDDCPLLRQRYTSQRGIYLEEEISSDPTSGDSKQEGNNGAQTSISCCFPSLLKKEKPGEA
ncbi:disease resistance protein RPP4-like isoform X1 [Coffea eugenioides]|uniref:disease resistance protein RPP4-like isoform X1 n=1 Tax=Coffea eugenioides TaxID=49369 RepID=UPI000F6081F7|nr:disease resistance protein RPP4-like isoform X1 [Coffea eugenioides]XP_027180115.1 disease resistance protein RPP4-like isoform X1 [Coffea eugenioides]XP_027180123.1 disease resistance protein RPP4-like isoform X1 [Coffea eugenioides]XP_027180130.1 disease resistance protein RPP4-like isoform X1 [Coffea eugenioides]